MSTRPTPPGIQPSSGCSRSRPLNCIPPGRPQGRGDLPQQAAGRQAHEVPDGRGRQVRASRTCTTYTPASLPSTVAPGGATLTLPKELQGGKDKRGPQPDIDSIHRWTGVGVSLVEIV